MDTKQERKTIYVFGNRDVPEDTIALELAPMLKEAFPNIDFIEMESTVDFDPDTDHPIVIDAAKGINKVELILDLKQIEQTESVSMHDHDLGFTLQFLKKIGKIKDMTIIAIPCDMGRLVALEEVKEKIKQIGLG